MGEGTTPPERGAPWADTKRKTWGRKSFPFNALSTTNFKATARGEDGYKMTDFFHCVPFDN